MRGPSMPQPTREASMGWSILIRRKPLKKLLMNQRLKEVLIQLGVQWKRLIHMNMLLILRSSQTEHVAAIDGCILQQLQL